MKSQELKKLSEHMDRQIANRFDEYRKFDDYVKQEVRHATSQMYKTLGILGTAVAVVLSVSGYFGLPFFVKQKVQDILQEATSREALATLSNQVVSVVQARVPAMIAKETATVAQALKADFKREINAVVQNAETDIEGKIAKVNESTRVASDAANAANDKLEFIELVFSAMAGNRPDYDKLIAESKTTNQYARLAKNAIIEIRNRYRLRQANPYDLRYNLQRKDRKLSRETLVEIAFADLEHNCDGAINELIETHDKGMAEVLVSVMQKSKRLESVYLSIVGINSLTGKRFEALEVDDVLSWWEKESTNSTYRSAYLPLHDLTWAICTRPKEKSKVENVRGNYEMAKGIVDSYPHSAEAHKYVVFLAIELADAVGEFSADMKDAAEKSLEALHRQVDLSDYYLCKVCYLVGNKWTWEELIELTNEAIKNTRDFEGVVKGEGRFSKEYLDRPEIDWPSKRQVAKKQTGNTLVALKTPVQLVKPQRSSIGTRDATSDNTVGFVSVKVKKGRRALTELPFVKSGLVTNDKLSSLTGCEEGDEISWRPSDESNVAVYRYRDGHWRNENDDLADEVVIPMGDAVLYYDRKVDVESQIGFSGQVEGVK